MNDRDCPIGDCAGTVQFDDAVVEIAPRFQLHDLGDVDEFTACTDCDAEVAGFYEEPVEGDGDRGVELILDIDEDEADDAQSGDDDSLTADDFDDSDDSLTADDFDDSDDSLTADDFDDSDDSLTADDFDDPNDVLDEADVDALADDDA